MLPFGAVPPTQFPPVVQVALLDPLQVLVAPWADTLTARATIGMRREVAQPRKKTLVVILLKVFMLLEGTVIL